MPEIRMNTRGLTMVSKPKGLRRFSKTSSAYPSIFPKVGSTAELNLVIELTQPQTLIIACILVRRQVIPKILFVFP